MSQPKCRTNSKNKRNNMSNEEEKYTGGHLELLGLKVKDKVTGQKGVVTSISYDLYGCIQAVVTDTKGEGKWFDVTRLVFKNLTPVMDVPYFSKGCIAEGKNGSAAQPLP